MGFMGRKKESIDVKDAKEEKAEKPEKPEKEEKERKKRWIKYASLHIESFDNAKKLIIWQVDLFLSSPIYNIYFINI